MRYAKDRVKLTTQPDLTVYLELLGSTVMCKQYAGFLAQGCFHKNKHEFSNQAPLQEKLTLPHSVAIRLG